jgi:hypothetical protein
VEDGTHEELLKLNGHYSRMWSLQAGGFLPSSEEQEKDPIEEAPAIS